MIQNYTMTASMFGRTSKSRSESTTDYYFAPSLKIANPFVSNSQALAMMAQFDMFNNPDYKNQMAAANAKLPRKGVPLKTVTTTVMTDEKGKQETSTTIMEMVNFKAANIPASAFAVPSDYKMIEMPSLNAATTAEGTTNPDGSKNKGTGVVGEIAAEGKAGMVEGAKEGVKEGAKEAAKKKLKGIFKR